MKTKLTQCLLVALLSVAFTLTVQAQTSAFTYQGRLTDSNGQANGIYDLQFTIYDAATGGTVVAGPVTNSAVAVTNGLFTTTLDFGPGVFNGSDRWLEIGVATNGPAPAGFTNLVPRQLITSAPYAIQAANAASAATVAAANITGTIATTQLPTTVVTNGASGVNITGTFSGDGSGVTNVPGTMPWQSTGGTNITAAANQAYLLTNSAPATVTLPTNATVGDVVTVSGTGSNGWQVAAGSGQSIAGSSPGIYWITTNNAPVGDWRSVASSADGTRLVAVANGGGIYTSTNSGDSWTDNNNAPSGAGWRSVASSADGTRLVAVAFAGGIYTSTNSGVSWSDSNNAPSAQWISVASSADGTKLVAAVAFTGRIYTSTNSGVSWSDNNNAPSANWASVASSADGTKLVAADGNIYTSTNSGISWSDNNNAPGTFWQSVASSADGTKLVAVAEFRRIYTSTDSGVSWSDNNNAPSTNYWQSVASSADGTKLVAVVPVVGGVPGGIYTSTDSGVSWSANNNAPLTNWQSVASSADGTKLVAVVSLGRIWTSGPVVSGPSGTTVQFQYLGNGVWQPVGEPASQIVGTLSPSQLPSNLVTNRENGVTLGGSFSGAFNGVGTGLTGLNAANLTGSVPAASLTSVPAASLTGTVPDARLSTNVALRSGGNAFSGNQTVTGGNVGIGTASPATGLQVSNNFYYDTTEIDSANAGGAWLQLSDVGGGGRNWALIATGTNNGEGPGQLLFRDDNVGTVRMMINTNGNVGIGTSSPHEEKLVVSGGVDVTGAAASPTTDSGLGLSFESYGGRIQSFRNAPLILNPIANDVGIGVTNPTSLLDVAGTITCTVLNQTSDRNAKRDFTAINPAKVLQKVASLPITEWQYKTGPQGVEHVGPMAQDFHAAFGLNGSDNRHITTVDEGGVALAAIQGLNDKVDVRSQRSELRIQKLETENAELKQKLNQLVRVVNKLSQKINGGAR